MLCEKCKTENQKISNFCAHCGAALKKGKVLKRGKGKWIFVLLGVLIFFVGLGLFFRHNILAPRQKKGEKTILDSQGAKSRQPKKKTLPSKRPVEERVKKVLAPKQIPLKKVGTRGVMQLPVGWMVIKNQWGKQVSSLPSVVVGGTMIALPTQACLGGDKWLFRPGERDEAKFGGGIWRDGDPISLWFLEEGKKFEGPELSPWAENEPVEWLSIVSSGVPRPVEISPLQEQGLFMECSLPKSANEPGVFIQDNQVVGWTFGNWQEGGFLWIGQEGENLDYEISVENFYIITFANGREEQFSKALAIEKDIPALDRLETFAEGFLLSPKLSEGETPSYLRPESILKQMRFLVALLIEKGLSRNVADLLGHNIILEASDPFLLMDVILATVKGYGYERAIQLAEGVGEYIKRDYRREIPQFDRLHAQLYKNWIMEFLANEDLREGLQVFEMGREYFPDDPAIHLLGVQLALAGGDWTEAERLLYVRDYPQSLLDRASILGASISELKGQAEKIMIRFRPGSGRIPVGAMLNGTFRQSFLVDTGASLVTVPSSTIEALGIEVGANNPRRKTSTAGGMVIVPEVVFSSIEVGGWTTHNVKALVLDIPNHPGLGLLGLNYLRRFHMEINDREGVFFLKPR